MSEEMRRQVLDAYRRAWRFRRATGTDSTSLLDDEWARIGYTPDDDERELWLEAWRSAVPPRRLGRFVVRLTGRMLVSGVREVQAVLNDPELPDWLLPPPRYRLLSVGFVRGDVEKRSVPFTPDPEASDVLDRMRQLRIRKDGHRKVRVWLEPAEDRSRVPVMVGLSRVGWTTLDKAQVRRLRPRPWARVTKVADGHLRFIVSCEGALTSGRLKVHLPPPAHSS